MPPRFSYWTIILDGQPTAFRAAEPQELQPTLNQLRKKNPNAEMKWFARGRCGTRPRSRSARGTDSDNAAKDAALAKQRGRSWRPGGEHKDPREKFKKETFQAHKRREKKAANLAREAAIAGGSRAGVSTSGRGSSGQALRLRRGPGGRGRLRTKCDRGAGVGRPPGREPGTQGTARRATTGGRSGLSPPSPMLRPAVDRPRGPWKPTGDGPRAGRAPSARRLRRDRRPAARAVSKPTGARRRARGSREGRDCGPWKPREDCGPGGPPPRGDRPQGSGRREATAGQAAGRPMGYGGTSDRPRGPWKPKGPALRARRMPKGPGDSGRRSRAVSPRGTGRLRLRPRDYGGAGAVPAAREAAGLPARARGSRRDLAIAGRSDAAGAIAGRVVRLRREATAGQAVVSAQRSAVGYSDRPRGPGSRRGPGDRWALEAERDRGPGGPPSPERHGGSGGVPAQGSRRSATGRRGMGADGLRPRGPRSRAIASVAVEAEGGSRARWVRLRQRPTAGRAGVPAERAGRVRAAVAPAVPPEGRFAGGPSGEPSAARGSSARAGSQTAAAAPVGAGCASARADAMCPGTARAPDAAVRARRAGSGAQDQDAAAEGAEEVGCAGRPTDRRRESELLGVRVRLSQRQ